MNESIQSNYAFLYRIIIIVLIFYDFFFFRFIKRVQVSMEVNVSGFVWKFMMLKVD